MSRKLSKQRRAALAGGMAKSKRPITMIEAAWDHGATGQANRAGLVIEERGDLDAKTGKVMNPNGVTGVRRVDLLGFWHGRGSISTSGFNAAVILRDAFEGTMRGKPALPENDRVQSSPKPDHAVTIQIDRIAKFTKFMGMVWDSDRQIIAACVLDGHHPSSVYGALRVREGFAHLRLALDRLSESMARTR